MPCGPHSHAVAVHRPRHRSTHRARSAIDRAGTCARTGWVQSWPATTAATWPDVFVANDSVPNFLFHHGRNLLFEETALAAGVRWLTSERGPETNFSSSSAVWVCGGAWILRPP